VVRKLTLSRFHRIPELNGRTDRQADGWTDGQTGRNCYIDNRPNSDMIEVYKILTNKYDSRVNLYLEKQQDSITRGHSLKLANNRYHYDLRKIYFAPRIVNVWNSLPEIVISADTPDTFKRRLDKFWQHQDILYDYNRLS